MKIRLIYLAILISLFGCRSYKFSDTGFKVENDPYYHDAEAKRSFHLPSTTTMVNIKKLARKEQKILKRLGLPQKGIEALFVMNETTPNPYSIIAWKSNTLYSFEGYMHLTSGKQTYKYKKISKGNQQIAHVIYNPFQNQQIGLIFLYPKKQDGYFIDGYLKENLAKRTFLPDMTFSDCPADVKVALEINLPKELVLNNHTLIKVYRLVEQQYNLELYTLRQPKEYPGIVFQVCPAKYKVVYSDLHHKPLYTYEINMENAKPD